MDNITDKVIVGKNSVIYVTSDVTLPANTYDTVVFTGNYAFITLPAASDSINGQEINFQNNGTGTLYVIPATGNTISNNNNSGTKLEILVNTNRTLIVNVNTSSWLVNDAAVNYTSDTNMAALVTSKWAGQGATLPAIGRNWSGICWSPKLGIFCAVDRYGGYSGTSPDGINWTISTQFIDPLLAVFPFSDVCWSEELGIFCATAEKAYIPPPPPSPIVYSIATSPDGLNWTARLAPSLRDASALGEIIWVKELSLFIVVSNYNTTIMTSPDGINWTARVDQAAAVISPMSVAWSPELKLAVALATDSGNYYTSPDGINWTLRNNGFSNRFQSLAWSSQLGLFCGVQGSEYSGSTATFTTIRSADGLNWTRETYAITGNSVSICWAAELGIFCAIIRGNSPSAVNISYNGTTWTSISGTTNIISATGTYVSICWAPELNMFCAAGSGTYPLVVSNLQVRKPVAANIFGNGLNNVSELGLWNFQKFGRNAPSASLRTGAYTIPDGENWVITTGGATLTLPAAASYSGREIMIQTRTANAVISATSNVVPLTSVVAGTAILAAVAGSWAVLVSDGINWIIMKAK